MYGYMLQVIFLASLFATIYMLNPGTKYIAISVTIAGKRLRTLYGYIMQTAVVCEYLFLLKFKLFEWK